MNNRLHSISIIITLIQFGTVFAPDLHKRTLSSPPSSTITLTPRMEKKLTRTISLPATILTKSKNPRLLELVSRNNICDVKNYLQHGGNPNQRNDLGVTALHIAARNNYLAMTGLLLQHRANPNTTDTIPLWKCTPLHWAVIKQNMQVLQLLLKHSAIDCSIQDATGLTALDIAKEHNFVEIINLFGK